MVRRSVQPTLGGIWYEVTCDRCLFRMDVFKPKRIFA